jgi:uncharacterized membrane protein YdjX (TVP38/TMEM64 family)
MNAQLWRRIIAIGLVATSLYVVGRSTGLTTVSGDAVTRWLTDAPAPAPLLYVGLFGVLNTVGLPMPVLCAIAGVVFGTAPGTSLAVIAMMSTATVQFLVARYLAGRRLRAALARRLAWVDSLLRHHGTLAVAVARLMPGPFSEFNLAAGLSRIRLSPFLLGTLLGSVPKVAFWAGLGAAVFGVRP